MHLLFIADINSDKKCKGFGTDFQKRIGDVVTFLPREQKYNPLIKYASFTKENFVAKAYISARYIRFYT
jgi:hypothetical protein